MPSWIAVRANSAQLQRESERSTLSGSSHASFTSVVATTGGKNRHAPASGLVGQAMNSPFDEAFGPLSNDPTLAPQLSRDNGQRLPRGNAQNDLRANDIAMRRAKPAGARFELFALLRCQSNHDRCHIHAGTTARPPSSGPTFRWSLSSGPVY